MKLLFDQNLAAVLVLRLSDLYPDSVHLRTLGLEGAPDAKVWEYAKANGYCIVSKDSDFQQRSLLFGPPPKVVWLRIGNCTTQQIDQLLRKFSAELHTFDVSPVESVLALS